MKKILLLLLFFACTSTCGAQQKTSSIEDKITDKIAKENSVCTSCKFIVQKIDSPWIKNRDLYEITTFDILPPPAWHAAAKGSSDIVILDYKKIEDWNKVIAGEKIGLDKDNKAIDYAKFFLSMTMNQSEYIEKLLKSEVDRIETREKKKIEPQTRVTRTSDKIQIVFYANDSQGDLQQWNMILKDNGEILKLQERSF